MEVCLLGLGFCALRHSHSKSELLRNRVDLAPVQLPVAGRPHPIAVLGSGS